MFDQTFVDGNGASDHGRTGKAWSMAASLLAEFGAIGVLLLIPLIWTEALPKTQFVNSLTAPAPPPAPPPPVKATVVKQVRAVPRTFVPRAPEASRETPRPAMAALMTDDAPLPVGETLTGLSDVISSGIAGGIGGAVSRPAPVPAPLPASKPESKPGPEKPLPVGGQVQSAKLIKHPAPVYPAIARTARIQGIVVLQAIIGKDGTVRDLTVIGTASPLLVAAAKEAVRQWVYQPTFLNRQPVEVTTEITVTFSLQ